MICLAVSTTASFGLAAQTGKPAAAKPATAKPAAAKPTPASKLPPGEVDGLMAPVALYPDQLLAQMLLAAATPARITELDKWLKTKPPFTGTALQDAAKQAGYEPPLVALVLFPQVVDFMAVNLDWTTEVGQAFAADRNGVLEGVQRLRADALKNGKLKSTPQQSISLKTVETGQQIIVIEPANPQVVYVPQYNTQTVYSTPPTTTTTVVIKEEDDDDEAAAIAAGGVIGFTAGIAIGAAMDNDYYYGPYGWHGSPYMYGGGWDDYYDDREDAREDYYEHREDAREDFYENRENVSENRSERAQNAQEQRGERSSTAQQQRTERSQTRQQSGASAQSAASGTARTQSAGATTQSASGTSSYQAKGQNRDRSSTATERSGTKSDAFSNYSSGKSERSASARGQSSRSGGGGRSGGRSGGGGGGRRR
jgi:uncharacterized membrane protein YgcG